MKEKFGLKIPFEALKQFFCILTSVWMDAKKTKMDKKFSIFSFFLLIFYQNCKAKNFRSAIRGSWNIKVLL